MTPRTNPNVLLFLAQGFEDLEAVTFLDVCGWTEYREHIPTVHVTTAGFHQEIRGRYGLILRQETAFHDVVPADYSPLALPGGLHVYTVRHTGDAHYGKGIYRGRTRTRWVASLSTSSARRKSGSLPGDARS